MTKEYDSSDYHYVQQPEADQIVADRFQNLRWWEGARYGADYDADFDYPIWEDEDTDSLLNNAQ